MHKIRHSLATAALLVMGITSSATAGTVLQLYYDGVPGTTVSSLTSSGFFPASPTDYDVLVANLEKGVFGDNYGSWTRGFIEAPQSGSYLFWIASDDDSEFWLSTDHTPANRVKLAENLGAVGFRDYTAKPAQQSVSVNLTRGQKYYFEILHKEGTGDDHVSVGWQLPDGTLERPIPGERLMPFPVDGAYNPQDKAPQILTDYFFATVPQLEAVTSVEESRSVTLAVTIEATQPASIQWFSNNVPIPDAILSTYTIASVPLSANNAEYRVQVSNALGGPVSASTVLQVTADVTPPVLVSALNLGRTVGSVVVVFSEPVEPVSATTVGNYSINNGATISQAIMGSKPGTVILKTSALVAGTPYTLTVSNVKDASVAQHVISPNPSAIPIDDQIFFWLGFDEGDNVTATDASGNGRNGTMANGATATFAGKIHGAAGFDGINDHTVVAGTGFDDWTGGMTVAAWLRPANVANWSRIIDFSNGAANDNILFARSGVSSGITFEVYNGGVTGGKVTANGVIVLNHWQHFAATMDASGFVKIYKDGVVVATGNTAVPNLVARANNYIARSAWTGDGYYGGKMDDARVYKRVLSDEEIAALSGGDPSLPEVNVLTTIAMAAEEGPVSGEITVTRTGSTTAPLTVHYLISGTAENGVDYATLPGSVTIPIGASTAAIAITPIDDDVLDPVETVILTLAADPAYQTGASDSGMVTIQDNEDNIPPTVVTVTVDNELPTFATTRVDVWFDEPVLLGATDPGNYVFSQAGVTVNSATLDARSRRVLLTLSGPLNDGGTLTVSNVRDLGGNGMGSVVRPIQSRLTPVNVIANSYNSPVPRNQVFALTSNGVVDNIANAGGWDTFSSARRDLTHFVGMLYPNTELFNVVKVDLGIQFNDGGSWAAQPRVFILKNQVDPFPGQPELDPANWREVPAQMISGSQFDPAGDGNPSPNTPIAFDLSNVPVADRTGFGWAVGGAQGDNSLQFLSITETRGYGVAATNRVVQIQSHPQNRIALQGQEVTFAVVAEGSWPITYQWLQNDVPIPDATNSTYITPSLTLGDTGSQFKVMVSNPEGSVTSNSGGVTVNADTTPPEVTVVTVDTGINVWFNEAVSAASATTMGNYTLSEPGVTITGATALGAYGRGVALQISQPLGGNPSTLTVANVQDLFGNTIVTAAIPIERRLQAVNVVGFNYNSPTVRNDCFILSNNDIVDNINNAGGWDTWASRDIGTRFSGMLYGANQLFSAIKVDLGRQFGDGGNYAQTPKVYLLKNNVDTDRARPETDINWVEVPAHLVSASKFDPAADLTGEVSPSTPIVFSLNHLPAGQRTGYGWAVGGVQGDGSITFTSLSELRAYGVPAPSLEPPLEIALSGNNIVISWPADATGFVLKTTTSLTSPSWSTVAETPQLVGDRMVVTLPISNNGGFYRLEK